MQNNNIKVINTDGEHPRQTYGGTTISSNTKATNDGILHIKNKVNYIYSKRRNYNTSKTRILNANR
jgi:hypothetical protein